MLQSDDAEERREQVAGGPIRVRVDDTSPGFDDADGAKHLGRLLAGRYAIIEQIGAGGMARVYRGRHVTLRRPVAVKILREQFASKTSFVGRFLREARATARIRHPNVVEILDFGQESDGTVYCVMELLPGEPLSETLAREGSFSWSRAKSLILQVCDALEAAHDVGVVHRDVKPDNCLRLATSTRQDAGDVVKVIDFGIAKMFGDDDPVGQRVTLGMQGHEGTPYEVIGVVGDVRHGGLHVPSPTAMYVALDQTPRLTLRFIMRTATAPDALATVVRQAIREIEPDQPIAEIVSLDATVRRAAARERMISVLLGGFAGLALLLAALGIYGVVAYGVSQRMREMGIRIALGAVPSRVVRMVVADSAVWWGAGLAIGLVLAAATTRVLQSLVYGVSVRDATTFIGVALLLALAAVLASLIPALRASRADPTRAFR